MRSFLTACIALCAVVSISGSAHAGPTEDRLAALERQAMFIEDIQESLYIMGYLALDDIDGSLGPKTTMAIRRFETDHGLVRTGEATDGLRQLLIDMAFPELPNNPELIGVISVADDTKWGSAFGRYTVEVARHVAIRRCERNSRTDRYCDEHVVVMSGREWSVTVLCGRMYSSSVGDTQEVARQKAVTSSREAGSRAYCSTLLVTNATFGQYIDPEERLALSRPVAENPRSAPNAVPVGRRNTDI